MQLPEFKWTHRAPLLAVSLVVAFATLGSVSAFAAGVKEIGHPVATTLGVQTTTSDLMRLERMNPPSNKPAVVEDEMEQQEVDRSHLPAALGSPRVASIPSLPPEMLTGYQRDKFGLHAYSPQTVGVNVRAATLSGFNPTNAFPPDCDGAIGPTQYIVGVNGRIVSFNKTTGLQDGVLNLSTDNFFNSVRGAIGTSDPMVRYDRLSGRWFLSIINVSTPNRWLLGVSDAASNGVISGSTVWTFFFFVPASVSPSIGNCLTDYPSLGVDANALYMGGDEFCPSTFQETDGFVIRKSSVLGAGPMVVTVFRNLMSSPTFVGPFAPRGVDNLDPGTNEGYFIGADGAAEGLIDMYRISDPGGTPGISAMIPITVPLTSEPFHVPHLGNTGGSAGRVDALDSRLFHTQMRGQQLWTSHTIAVDNTGAVGNNTRDGSRWYQFNVPVNTGAPTIVQSGIVFTPSATNNVGVNRYYWMPSIAVSGQGHAAMGFSAGDSVERINCATVGRLANDPAGAMGTPVLLTASTTAYNPPGDTGAGRGRRRWGDYSITTVDPIDDQSMWTVQMWCDSTNSYGVRVARLIAPPPATPSGMADVPAGYSNVPVTLSGTSSSGSGFFDPGANLPGVPAFSHLTATITNGAATGTPPTVVSATYVNPTTVNLVLNTSAATPNLPSEFYTITITNPDGQSLGAAIVHVVSATTYTIDASAGAGGSIAPSGTVTVNSGQSQAFTISPNACFAIADVQVDGGSVGAVSSYTFSNVTANHTIAASFAAQGPYTIHATAGLHGSIAPSGDVSVNCGASQAFTIAADACYHVADVVVDGVSRGAVSSYTFTNVGTNHTIDASFAANAAPAAVTALTAAQVKSGNDASGTTKITLTFTAPGGATSVEVWRKGYGNYALYDGGGSVPTLPASYPPAGWTLTSVANSGDTDQPSSRDFWYYVAYAKDACSVSAVSNMTSGTLDYHLGDVTDGVTPGQGDNTVNTADASLLGAHYGDSGGALAGFEYLDVGPTTDFTTDGRPTPDGSIGFEDLVMFALNYTPNVSVVAKGAPVSSVKTGGTGISLEAPFVVTAGEAINVPVRVTAGGDVQALSVTLGWDPAVVAPVDVVSGEFAGPQGGVVFSPGGGRVDAAVLGAGGRFGGEGLLATMHFRAIASGDPKFGFAKVVGRDGANKAVSIKTQTPLAHDALVTATELFPVIPNPSRGTSVMRFALARSGPVDLSIYSVDGRRVATLAHGIHDVGNYHVTWNGTDESGGLAKSGLYFVRLQAPGLKQSRLMTLVR